MKLFYKLICRVLIASMILLSCNVNAGMVGTEQAVASAQDLANRDKVRDFFTRENVAGKLQSMGVSPATAQERVNAMTQDEVNKLAGNIDTMPAGATSSGWWWALGVIVVAGVIYFVWGPGNKTR